MLENWLLKRITDFYINSNDFNGIPISRLLQEVNLSWPELRDSLIELIKNDEITLTFSSVFVNPHIKAFKDLPIDQQVQKLQTESPDEICAYPTAIVIQSVINIDAYTNKPFTKRLLLGEPQLLPLFFDLEVLEKYYNDPRYNFRFYDYGGGISISDRYYESKETAKRDKIFLQTFGVGYDQNMNRVAVVFLRYLSNLSPEHQQFWNTHICALECKMSKEYYANSFLGQWVDHGSIYQAFLVEQVVINDMSKLMSRPPLFRETFEENRPREFSFFLRPTLKNYENFVHLLDKMIADNINKDFFHNEIPLEEKIKHPDGTIEARPKGTLSLLDEWLRKSVKVLDNKVFDEIIQPFKEVRKLRQKPAHTVLKDEYNGKYYSEQEALIRRVYKAVRTIRLLFANHPTVRDYKVPDWLYKGRIKSY